MLNKCALSIGVLSVTWSFNNFRYVTFIYSIDHYPSIIPVQFEVRCNHMALNVLRIFTSTLTIDLWKLLEWKTFDLWQRRKNVFHLWIYTIHTKHILCIHTTSIFFVVSEKPACHYICKAVCTSQLIISVCYKDRNNSPKPS